MSKKESMKKWANELERKFSKEEVQITKKYTKKSSTSLSIKKVQVKTILMFHLTPVRTHTTANVGKDAGKRTIAH
jgi:hypothetical protein